MRDDHRFGTIPGMALRSAEEFGGSPAVVDGDVTLTFADVAEGMASVGRGLMALGVKPGDRVALWAPNSAVWVLAALGVHACGAWLVPLNTRFKAAEAADVIGRADVRAVLTVESFLGTDYSRMLRRDAPSALDGREVVLLPDPGSITSPPWDAFVARGEAVAAGDLVSALEAVGPSDVSDVIFTSGTTGRPKGVMLRHGTSLRAFEAYNAGTRLSAKDRNAIAVPFFHCFGYKAGWMLDLMVGAVSYPIAVFDSERILQLVDREKITHMGAPPTLFQSILDHPRRGLYDLSSLRSVVVSSMSVDPSLITRLRRDPGVEGAISGYGLTESHALVSVADPDDPPEVIATTVGKPIEGIDVRIVDDAGATVAAGEQGELHVRGYTIMDGYFRDPDATAEVVVDGWLHTGDVATLDDQGYLRIVDRKKDIYVMGGFNVSPAEVEAALRKFDKVGDVAVVAMPDAIYGEVGAAFVVAAPGVKVAADEVIAFARAQLANFKVPRRVEIIDQLPTNATGKVVKPLLRALLDGTPR